MPSHNTALLKICVAILSRYVLGWGIGQLILPAQVMFPKKLPRMSPTKITTNQAELDFFGVSTADGVVLDTVEISCDSKNPSQQYVIKFCGNAMSYHESMAELVATAQQNNVNVIGFDYPNVGASSSVLIYSQAKLLNAGIAQVQRLLDKGVNPENITLHGLSLGGAVATLVAAHFHQQNPAKTVYLINDRSFSSIGNVVSGLLGNSVMETPIKLALYLLQWDMNAAHAYRNIPATHKTIIVSKDDSVINYRLASLYQAVKPYLKQKYADDIPAYKRITHAFKVGNGHMLRFVHMEPLNSLRDKDNRAMVNAVNNFIQRKCKAS